MIGQTISHYRITAKLGAGGMGEVYLATDTTLDRQVALKFLPESLQNDPESRERLLREAKAASRLNHPNVLTVHSVETVGGRDFFVMEYIDGPTLRDLIDQGPPSYPETNRIAAEIAAGLASAHRHQITHRDIKPTNIMLTRDGTVKLMDFGLARVQGRSDLTKAGAILGTVSYMSPEQVKGLPTNSLSDIFSFGAVLYELVTGCRPFEGAHDAAIMYAVCNEDPVSPCKHNETVPTALARVILKALAKDPNDRYQDAAELLDDLKSLAGSETAFSNTNTRSVADRPVTGSVKSLAVLYLRNLGKDDDEFLSYGITEDLIVDLTRVGTLRVSPMRSVLKFKDSDADLAEIATALDVGLILDGSLHRSDTAIRISAQLVDIGTGKNLWAERWEESNDTLPQIKKALARGITAALSLDSSVVKAAQIGRPEGHNPKAYEFYLRGKYVFEHKEDASDLNIAQEMYQQALAEEPSLLAARSGLAELKMFQSDDDAAFRELNDALAAARSRGLLADEARILRLLASLRFFHHEFDAAEQLAREALGLFERLGDLSGESGALARLIDVLQVRSRFEEALKLSERVLEINRSVGDNEKEAEALRSLGWVYLRLGEYARARHLIDEALAIAQRNDLKWLEAMCIATIGAVEYHTGDFANALRNYDTSLSVARRFGIVDERISGLYNNKALVVAAVGDYRQALELYEDAAEILKKLGRACRSPAICLNTGNIFSILGERDRAKTLVFEGLEIAEKLEYPLMIAEAHACIGTVNARVGERAIALESFKRALCLAGEFGHRDSLARTHANLAELRFQMEDYASCRQHATQALESAEKLGMTSVQVQASAHMAAVTVHDGQFLEGIEQLREILDQAGEHGDPLYILIAQRLLGQMLLEHGPTVAERTEGRKVLEAALALATEKEIAYEAEWIEKIINGR